ncbi:MAG TPA: class I SAM-dependent methyltransferase, partial [Chloroflexia bacterium]|nr:class I SAM-dependent methyltransferase [Chloroflexia bacterium]
MGDPVTYTPENQRVVPGEVIAYYEQGKESTRLTSGSSMLEAARTREILSRYLPHVPATILDVGGGAGPYALWLARQGYQVHLLDPVPLHIDQARQASQAQPEAPITSFTLGDARRLLHRDNSVDAL